ncbi:MAG: FG-GAP-like repeat-containing protein, partial [Ignavibacteria bacterium]|nr:FG-GAP-like repeat-containing protein [Ignavibacteria bacterium]
MKYLLTLLTLILLPVLTSAQEWRINCGGDDYTVAGGDLFEQDLMYSPGSYGALNGNTRDWFPNEILGTTDDTLYSTMRFLNAPFGYQFDGMAPGTYELTLHFIETSVTGPGGRLIDVVAEGITVIDDLDIFDETGAIFTALVKTVQVDVSDDTLNLDFITVLGNNAFVSAIEVVMIGTLPTTFVDVTADVGLVLSHATAPVCAPPIGSGSAWGDYDNDGDVDFFVTNHGGANHLYRNDGDLDLDGLPDFVDEAVAMGLDLPAEVSMGCVFIDFDNDGDQDLYVTNLDGNMMFRNELVETGSVSFTDITMTTGLADEGRAITAGWGDFDNDGFLDVYLAKHANCMGGPWDNQDRLFRNNGDGTFVDVTDYLCDGVAPCDAVMGLGFSPGWYDYDNDGDIDLYLVNDILDGTWYGNVLWRNDGDNGLGGWTFTDVSASSGTDLSVNGMGLGIGDYDNDGNMDLAFSNVGPNNLLHNLGDGTYEDVSAAAGIQRDTIAGGEASITWGTSFFDHDNDGLLDLFYVAGYIGGTAVDQPDAFFRNNGDGTFEDRSDLAGLNHPGRARSLSVSDFDGDGFPDVFVGHFGEPPVLYHNESSDLGNSNNWLQFTVEGTTSNRDGIGARLTLTTPDAVTRIREIGSGATHGGGDQRVAMFGIGNNATGDLVVRWPSGLEEDFGTIDANQRLHLVENSTQTTFTDISVTAGLVPGHDLDTTCPMPPIGSGSAWADYDDDGDIDLFVTNHGGPNHLYRNDGDQGLGYPEFVDVAVDLGIDDASLVSAGCVFIDFDNDGDHDLYVTHWGGNTLYQNQLVESGAADFVDVTAVAGVG